MPSASNSITIERPAADVFAYVADGMNGPKWRPGILDIDLASGSGLGAIYRQGVKGPGGRRIAADHRYLDALEHGAPFEDPRLTQDWLRAKHERQLRQAPGLRRIAKQWRADAEASLRQNRAERAKRRSEA